MAGVNVKIVSLYCDFTNEVKGNVQLVEMPLKILIQSSNDHQRQILCVKKTEKFIYETNQSTRI